MRDKAKDESYWQERRDFVQLSAGIISGLAIPGWGALGNDLHDSESVKSLILDDSYLVKGLTGMARSQGWFKAHLGAAVIAGYFLCRENRLAPALVNRIKKQLDTLIEVNHEQFRPFDDPEPDASGVASLIRSLRPAIEGGLRAHGHAVIYTSLAARALRQVPRMADPRIIKLLCAHNASIARKNPARPPKPRRYRNTQEMIKAYFDSLARFEPLFGRPSVKRPNFTHMTTHTEALLTLEELGEPELASAGFPGHQAHIQEPVPQFDPEKHPRVDVRCTLADVMDDAFWASPQNRQQWRGPWHIRDNRNGQWLAYGHLFKLLYSYHRLVSRNQDRQQVNLCSRILLERVVNPEVQGG